MSNESELPGTVSPSKPSIEPRSPSLLDARLTLESLEEPMLMNASASDTASFRDDYGTLMTTPPPSSAEETYPTLKPGEDPLSHQSKPSPIEVSDAPVTNPLNFIDIPTAPPTPTSLSSPPPVHSPPKRTKHRPPPISVGLHSDTSDPCHFSTQLRRSTVDSLSDDSNDPASCVQIVEVRGPSPARRSILHEIPDSPTRIVPPSQGPLTGTRGLSYGPPPTPGGMVYLPVHLQQPRNMPNDSAPASSPSYTLGGSQSSTPMMNMMNTLGSNLTQTNSPRLVPTVSFVPQTSHIRTMARTPPQTPGMPVSLNMPGTTSHMGVPPVSPAYSLYAQLPAAVGLNRMPPKNPQILSSGRSPRAALAFNPSWATFPLKVFRGVSHTTLVIKPNWDDEELLRELSNTYDSLRAWRKWLSLRDVK